MSINQIYKNILNIKRGRIALFISIGGLITTIIVTSFAFKVDNKLAQVEDNMLLISRSLKELRFISSAFVADTSDHLVAIKPVVEVRSNFGKKVQVYTIDSTLNKDSSSEFRKDVLPPAENPLQDTIKLADTLFIPASVLASIGDLNFSTIDPKQQGGVTSTNLSVRQTLFVFSQYTNQLKGENKALSEKIKNMEAELALLRDSRKNK